MTPLPDAASGVVSPCRPARGWSLEYHSNVAMLVRPGETLKLGWSDSEPVIHDTCSKRGLILHRIVGPMISI